jgi:hypothetical protein
MRILIAFGIGLVIVALCLLAAYRDRRKAERLAAMLRRSPDLVRELSAMVERVGVVRVGDMAVSPAIIRQLRRRR